MNKKLYIIGNGFDIHHNIKSKYLDFKKWLVGNNGYQFDFDDPDSFETRKVEYYTNYKRIEIYDGKSYAIMFYKLIEEACTQVNNEGIKDWSDFEKTLGMLSWENALDISDFVMYDDNNINDIRIMENIIEEQANTLCESSHILSDMFTKWIRDEVEPSIQKDNIPSYLYLPIDRNALFLSFNYTSTLETIYDIDNVLHIHGYCNNVESLVIGHGLNYFKPNNEFDEKYNVYTASFFKRIFEEYKKKTQTIMQRNSVFFSKLNDLEEIYIYGKSFSNDDVDLPYLKKIIESTCKKVTLFINIYGKQEEIEDKLSEYKSIIYNNVDSHKITDIKKWNI